MDVEAILNQIRERVVADPPVRSSDAALVANGPPSNGSPLTPNYDDALQRLRTHLAVAGRAADRLPPIFSNREGARARLELWLKNKSKPLTRWFTWEQVNFNRAINDALCDVVELLNAEARELAALRGQLNAWQTQLTREMQHQFSAVRAEAVELKSDQALFRFETEARLQQNDATFARLEEAISNLTTETGRRETEHANNYARLEGEHANLAAEYDSLLAAHNSLTAEHAKLSDQVIDLAASLRAEDREIKSAQDEEINRRLSQLAAELKEEQRVCFRQISLETGETAVLEDRARRALISRLDELEKTLKAGRRS